MLLTATVIEPQEDEDDEGVSRSASFVGGVSNVAVVPARIFQSFCSLTSKDTPSAVSSVSGLQTRTME